MIAINDIIIKRLRFLVKESNAIEQSTKKDIFGLIRLFNKSRNKYLNVYLINLYCQLEDIEHIKEYRNNIPINYYRDIVEWINKYKNSI